MQNRRDHVQAHRFAAGRLVSALLAGDPGPAEVPLRRGTLSVQFGVLLAALLAAGFAVLGLINPGTSTTWRKSGSIVVENETGNRFLYLGNQLYPIANYASALLAAGNGAKVVDVSRAALDGVQRGPQIGIPHAPDDVPPATALLTGSRAVCLAPGSGNELVDLAPAGRTTPVPDNRWVLVAGPQGAMYALWNGQKYPLRSHAELVALGMVTQQPITLSAVWLAELPTGVTLTAPHIPAAGSAGPSVAGGPATVGRLFQTTAAGAQELYVLRSDGLAPISRTEFALLSAAPGAAAPRQVSAADIAAAPVSQDRSLLTAVPDLLSGSAFSPGGSALCALQEAGATAGGTVVTEPAPADSRTSRLLVPPGGGMLVEPQSERSSDSPHLYLLTDTGLKYPLAGDAAVTALGYGQATVRTLPDHLLNLAPTGPTLDPAIARTAIGTTTG